MNFSHSHFTFVLTLSTAILFTACTNQDSASSSSSSSGGSGSVLNHGQLFEIAGSGFGERNDELSTWFENFETGDVDSLIGSEGYWSLYSDNEESLQPRYVLAEAVQRSPRSPQVAKIPLNLDVGQAGHDYIIKNGQDFSNNRAYLDFWLRFAWASDTVEHQIKAARLGAGTSDQYVYPHFIFSHWTYGDTPGHRSCYTEIRSGADAIPPNAGDANYDYDCPLVEAWSHIQLAADLGNCGASAGYYHIWMDGEYLGGDTNVSWWGCEDQPFRQVWIGGYLGNATPPLYAEIYYDDVYFSGSWARVELGNDPSYNACTHREIQEITQWTDSSITIRGNLGSFDTEGSAWLFVINDEGEPSDGIEVELGDI